MHLFRNNNRVHQLKKNYFQNRRWQLVNLLEELSGFWPYRSKLEQFPIQLFHFIAMLNIFSALAHNLILQVGVDANIAVDCSIFMAFIFGLFIKLLCGSVKQSTRLKIYEKIIKHFETLTDPEEAAALNEAAEQGFKYTVTVFGVACVLIVIFDSAPTLRSFYNYYYFDHELTLQMPVPMDFGFDHSKYWYIVAILFWTWACSGTLFDVAFDLSFMLQIKHSRALFKIIGIRLRRVSELVDEFENETISEEAANEAYSIISSAIRLHSECLELIELIEETYTFCWFMVLIMSTGGYGACIHLINLKLHDPIEAYRYISAFSILVLNFQVVFSRGQLLTDSAEAMLVVCYECKWYCLPKKSCKLLSTMMLRASIPSQLTGLKLFPLSMETFSNMLKAGISYYTVFEN